MSEKNNIKLAKWVFFGTPEVASQTLETLKSAGIAPSLIVTTPDKPRGRKLILTPSPVKIWAVENNIEVLQPEKIDGDFLTKLGTNYDFFLVVAYGKILPEALLNLPKFGCINVHYSLLPKYRGASPVESAILDGQTETGVTIQKIIYKLDAGDILAQEKISIENNENTPELLQKLTKLGADILIKVLPEFLQGIITGRAQDESAVSICKKITKEDGLVNLETETNEKLYNKFRAYKTWPRIYFIKNGKRVIVTDASLVNGKFVIKKVIPEGKKEIDYLLFQNSQNI